MRLANRPEEMQETVVVFPSLDKICYQSGGCSHKKSVRKGNKIHGTGSQMKSVTEVRGVMD